ncbi:hypothetical protein V8C44DRAFT_320783 [Trichoderma aethiopicum]
MQDQDTPITLRRSSRRLNAKSTTPPAMPSPPMTPHRRKRAFCCSDPGPSISSGLTPMIRRTYLAETPKGRQLVDMTPSSPTPRSKRQSDAGDLVLHQTLDGRVERRIRRSGLRDMLNRMQQEKRRAEQSAQAQIDGLKAEVRARDREIYELRNATVVMDTERVWDLEQQVRRLKGELAAKGSVIKEEGTQYYSWAEPSIEVPRNDEMDTTGDGPHFGGEDIVRVKMSPSRARSSFLTPPPTSPTVAASPCYREASPSPSSRHPQMDFSGPDKEQLEEEIASLQFKVHQLTATLDSYKASCGRISNTLSNASAKRNAVPSFEAIEKQVQLLLQNLSDRAAEARRVTYAVGQLGFPGNDASEMLASVAAGLRGARVELQYLTPDEVALPCTRRGSEVLDLLLARLRALTKKSREDDDAIDEYHEIEQSLRKELGSRASVVEELEKKLAAADGMLEERHAQQQLSEEMLTAQNATIAKLEARIEEERQKAKDALDSMKVELQRVLHLSQSLLNATASEAGR